MSRTDAKSTSLQRRPSRTVPASIVAGVLVAIGVLAVISAVYAMAGGGWPAAVTTPAGVVAGWTWGSAMIIGVAAATLVIGLVLLVAAIKPGGFTAAQLATPSGSEAAVTDVVISNRGLARLAAATADSIDGVDRVSTSATGREVRVAITTASHDQADLVRQRVQQAVTSRLQAAGLQPAPQVRTSVTTKN